MKDQPTEETSQELVRVSNPRIKRILPVSKARVYQLCDEGMPHFRLGKIVLLDPLEVERWVREHRRGCGQ